jgi:hypothetical protein
MPGLQTLATIVKTLSIAALLMASIFRTFAADYQVLLAFAVCLGALIVLRQALGVRAYGWALGFVAIAIIFNPVVLVIKPFGALSLAVYIACTAMFTLSLIGLQTPPPLTIQSITNPNPPRLSL